MGRRLGDREGNRLCQQPFADQATTFTQRDQQKAPDKDHPKAQKIFNQEGQGAGEGEICQQQNSRNGNGGGKLAGMMQYLSNHHHEKPSFQTKRSSVKSGR